MIKLSRLTTFAMLFLTLLVQTGCSVLEIKQQAESIDAAAQISGQFELSTSTTGQAYALLFKQGDVKYEIVKKTPLTSAGKYLFTVIPDTYFIGGFIDVNNDGVYLHGEPATYLGVEDHAPRIIGPQENEHLKLETLTISGPIKDRLAGGYVWNLNRADQNTGRVVSLDDDMFSRDNASEGFWKPLDYREKFGGGLMFLQDYEVGKTPVVFVHGVSGTALEFFGMIAALDREKFQPWILQYPSGFPLDLVSNYFVEAMNELEAKHDFENVIVIAHSMGGLMTRSFVMKQQESKSNYKLSMVMTINSPLYGMDSAASGVKSSPIVVPAWRDVASGSDFVKRVHAWDWPESIPYHLVCSFLPDESNDGVVPLKSQISLELQDEASEIYVFNMQHAEILQESAFIERFNAVLEQY